VYGSTIRLRDNTGGAAWVDAWERGAQAAIAELVAMGRIVRKVPIDFEALLAWCQAQDRPLDSAARAEYVTHLLQRP
jgi:hypothetical protein